MAEQMNQTKKVSYSNNAGCGCGSSNSACACGGAACELCNSGVLAQPRFFAGQLLTEDDLQSMVNYVTSKNRLHNRYLHGSGVACGLEVQCHPCAQGQVKVSPGYAVDCCGNDILLACEVTLDINQMVRELKLKRLGQDCGDPCESVLGAAKAYAKTSTNAANTNNGKDQQNNCHESYASRYCLYLSYCEQPGDLVTPYSQDAQCSQVCEASRIHEGYKFELRCVTEDEPASSLFQSLQDCLGDLEEADFFAKDLERSYQYMKQAEQALKASRLGHEAKFSNEDSVKFDQLMADFDKDANVFISDTERVAAKEVDGADVSNALLRRLSDATVDLSQAIFLFDQLNQSEKKQRISQNKDLVDKIERARWRIKALAPKAKVFTARLFDSAFESALAKAAFDASVRFTDKDISNIEAQVQAVPQANLFAYKLVIDSQSTILLNENLAKLQNWLLSKMNKRPPVTECGLYAEVASVELTHGDTFNQATINAFDVLFRAFFRYLVDCICSALLPDCPKCEDPAIKLACLQVDECKVDNICNLERTFILTENNLRYWIPFLQAIGELLEKFCCQFSKKLDIPIDIQSDANDIDLPGVNALEQGRQVFALNKRSNFFQSGHSNTETAKSNLVFANIMRLLGLNQSKSAALLNFSKNVAGMAIEIAPFNFLPRLDDAVIEGKSLESEKIAKFIEHPEIKQLIAAAAAEKINQRLDTVIDNSDKQGEEINQRLSGRIRELEDQLQKCLTASKLSSNPVVKGMKTELEESKSVLAQQKAVNAELIARIKKLEKAVRK